MPRNQDTPPSPDVRLARPEVHPGHPFRDEKSHEALLKYCTKRLDRAKKVRDAQVKRYARVDRQVSGWMKLSAEDRKRARQRDATGRPYALEMNLPLSWIHLDDMMTFFVEIFAPTSAMFHHRGKADEQVEGSQIVDLMNAHSVHAGYYREIVQACFNLVKYNIGGLLTYWDIESGLEFVQGENGQWEPREGIVWQGNRIESLDVYNLLLDPSVAPHCVGKDGEFAATVKKVSRFHLLRSGEAGRYFNLEEGLESGESTSCTYYINPPAEALKPNGSQDGIDEGDTDWTVILNPYAGHQAEDHGFEVVSMYIWLNPYQMNLVPRTRANLANRNRLEIWHITILNGKYIIGTEYINNAHRRLPFGIGVINDDLMGLSQKSNAEVLAPLQDFSSFLLNTHVQATRKNIWDLILYDAQYVDLNSMPEGEVAGRIALKTGLPAGKSIDSIIWQNSNQIDTQQTLRDLGAMMDLIQTFFPTQALPGQIAGIDRAVKDQVAAVLQGANRRMHKTCKLIDETMMRQIRFMMFYNILQYQPSGEVVGVDGRPITIDKGKLQESNVMYIIGQGIKALDKQYTAGQLKEVLYAILQSPVAAEVDILGLMSDWADLLGINTDLRNYYRQQQPQPQQPEGEMSGMEAGTGIVPTA